MSAPKNNDTMNLKYIKHVISEVIGEELWNGFYDVVTTEKPRIDMYDEGSCILVIAEAPGILNPDDISISVASNKLNIKGLMKDKYQRHKPGKVIKSECLYGAFNRIVELPYLVDEKSIKAIYENGLLEITMQRIDTVRDKTIDIEFKK